MSTSVEVVYIAGSERQESGRVDVARVGDEHDAMAVADAEAAIDAGALDLGAGEAFFAHVVESDAAIGRCFGGLDGEGRVMGEVVGPVHQFFAVLGRNGLQFFAAAYGDEIEEAPAHDFVLAEEFVDRGQVVGCLFGDEGVDLDGEADGGGISDGVDGPLEAAFDSADGFVARGGGAVEREAKRVDAVSLELFEDGGL